MDNFRVSVRAWTWHPGMNMPTEEGQSKKRRGVLAEAQLDRALNNADRHSGQRPLSSQGSLWKERGQRHHVLPPFLAQTCLQDLLPGPGVWTRQRWGSGSVSLSEHCLCARSYRVQ